MRRNRRRARARDRSAGRGGPADSSDILYTEDGLAGAEAVRYDPDQDVWFVANFGEDAEDARDANGTDTGRGQGASPDPPDGRR